MSKKKNKFSIWLKRAVSDVFGSETIEFVYAAAVCCFLILSCMLILGYAVQYDNVVHAGKQIARTIEVTGTAKDADISSLVSELLPNSSSIGARYKVTPDGSYISASERRIQLRQKFDVELWATYDIIVASSGDSSVNLSLPIYVKIPGQSEVYWKT